jgi:macrolide-specific efflux system membrane fusion protein
LLWLALPVLALPLHVVAQVEAPQRGAGAAHAAGAGRTEQAVTIPQCRVQVVDEVHLAAERGGILAEVAPAGAYVASGSVVAQLRDSVARAGLAIAEKEAANDIEVRFARKAAELAQLKYERTLQANRVLDGTVTELELRELRLDAEKSLLQLEQAEHQFAIASLRQAEQAEVLRTLQIVAPFDAFVRNVHRQPGEVVREGEVIVEIVNTDRVRVEGYLNPADLPYVAPGRLVSVRVTGDGVPPDARNRSFAGRVAFVDVKIEPVSQKVRVSAEVLNPDRLLRDGMTAAMTINPD